MKNNSRFALVLILFITVFFQSALLKGAPKTGIVQVKSIPEGAEVYIDNTYVGVTNYQNVELSVGKHFIRVHLNPEYPDQIWEVYVDEITPQIKAFIFDPKNKGKFTGKKIETTVEKYKGNVQIASIPNEADVFINGEKIGTTPMGYKDVDVGTYSILFISSSTKLDGTFTVIKNETVKLISDFNQSRIINKWEEELLRINQALAERSRKAEQERVERKRVLMLAEEERMKKENERLRLAEEERMKKVNERKRMILNEWGAITIEMNMESIPEWPEFTNGTKVSGLLDLKYSLGHYRIWEACNVVNNSKSHGDMNPVLYLYEGDLYKDEETKRNENYINEHFSLCLDEIGQVKKVAQKERSYSYNVIEETPEPSRRDSGFGSDYKTISFKRVVNKSNGYKLERPKYRGGYTYPEDDRRYFKNTVFLRSYEPSIVKVYADKKGDFFHNRKEDYKGSELFNKSMNMRFFDSTYYIKRGTPISPEQLVFYFEPGLFYTIILSFNATTGRVSLGMDVQEMPGEMIDIFLNSLDKPKYNQRKINIK